MQLFQPLQSLSILQHLQYKQPKTYLKNCVFFSYNENYLPLTLFSLLHKYQFVNKRSRYFSILWKILHKRVWNQIHGRGLDVHLLKTQSTAVEMFWIAKMFLFWTIIWEKCRKEWKKTLSLKNQLRKRYFYNGI